MKPLLSLFIIPLLLSPSVYAQSIQLTEAKLEELAKTGSPQIDQIQAAFLGSVLKESEVLQKYAPEAYGSGSYSETNERAIMTFQPIFSPVKYATVGVRKAFTNGIAANAFILSDQRSGFSPFVGRIREATTTTLAFTAQMDLWKNLLGKLSKAELETVALEKKRSELQREIELKTFKISLRRLYWSLVANKEALTISEGLKKTAEKQLSESKLRLKNRVAEADEVARYQAQAASREGTLLYLQYQKEALLKQLRNLLPELAGTEINLAPYDLNKTLMEVLVCAGTIAQQPGVPYNFTQYDETVKLLREIKSNTALINSRYAQPEVSLFNTLRSTGVSADSKSTRFTQGSYGGSIDDQLERNRTAYEVGISFTVPLGEAKETTQRVKELYDEKRLGASLKATETQVITTHEQLTKSISLLTDVIRAQRTTSEQLSKRLGLTRKKFDQARVSVDQLVIDQDALLNSELTTIETQLQILNTIFDYLVVFTETPCPFNRI